MNKEEYIKYYLVKDVVLAVVLVITGYAWYFLLGGDQVQEELAGANVAELVPVHSTNDT